MGSGLSTIPGPPPYGLSSTVRCGSLVCDRGSSVPTLSRPRSSARPTMPNFNAPLIISGNSVTTWMSTTVPLLEFQRPIHQDQSGVHLDLAQILRSREHPVLPPFGISHHHHRTRRCINKLHDVTELDTFEVPHRQSDQVGAIVLALSRRRHLSTLHLDHGTCQSGCGVAILNSVQPCDQPITVRLPLGHSTRYALARTNSQYPVGIPE